MNKYAKLISLVVLVIMVLSVGLVGCKTTEPEVSESTEPSESAEVSESVEASTEAGGEPISMWTWKLGYQEGFKAVGELANVEFTVEGTGEDAAYQSKVTGAANSGTLPDLVHWWGSADIAASPAMVDLSTIEAFNTDEFKAQIFSQAWTAVTIQQAQVDTWAASEDATEVQKAYKAGQFFLVPLDVGGFYTIYANKTLLEGAGIETDIPATWEDLYARMLAYKEATGGAGLACSTQIPNLVRNWMWSALEIMYNGIEGYAEVCDPFSEVPVNSEAHVHVVKVIEDLSTNELWVPGSLSMSIDEGDQSFYGEKAAYLLGGSFTAATLGAMGMDLSTVYSFPVPPLEGSKITEWALTPFCLTGIGISSNSEQQEAAIRYLTTFASVDGALAFANNGFSIPAVDLGDRVSELTPVLAAAASSYVTDGSDPLSQFTAQYPFAASKQGAPWMAAFENTMQQIVMGEKTAVDACQAADDSKAEEIELGNVVSPSPAAE